MIRDATPDDRDAVLSVVVAAGLFGPDELEPVEQLLAGFFAGASGEGHGYVVDVDDDDTVVGVSYDQPKSADGVVDLTMIAVHPGRQGRGRGRALLTHVEGRLLAEGRRLLVVETSGKPEYGQARAFYRAGAYAQVGRIADYWEPGDDLVLFAKALA